MGIDRPSDEFYNINTNQSGPPMSAQHKINSDYSDQIQLLNLIHFLRNQPEKDWSYILARTDIQTFDSFKSVRPLEIYMEQI